MIRADEVSGPAASRSTANLMRRHLPKYAVILDELRRRALTTREDESFGTMAGWKKEFKVSQATIDRALVELRREGLIESRRGSGTYATRRAAARHLGMFFGLDIFDSGKGEFPMLVLKALRIAASERGCVLRYYLPPSDGDVLEDRISSLQGDIQNHQVDGLIVWAVFSLGDGGLPIPCVSMGHVVGVRHSVDTDVVGVVRLATEELLRRGCRRIAFLKGGREMLNEPMLQVFHQTLKAAGGTSCPEWHRVLHGGSSQESAAVGAQEFKALWNALPEKPDGLISCDDYATAGALEAMRELDIRPGQTIQIASHANKGLNLFGDAPVIRIEFDPAEIAAGMLDLLNGVIDGNNREDAVTVVPHLKATG